MTEAKIAIYIPDPTYGKDVDNWEEESRQFKKEIEAEFQLRFDEADIGAGAAEPAFFTWLELEPWWPYVALALVFLFKGKSLKENVEAWSAIYKKLAAFFHRRPTFDRDGAAILAVNEITSQLGHFPSSFRLIGYRHITVFDDDSETPNEIAEAPARTLGMGIHVFHIEAENRAYRITVYGKEINLQAL
jgi:hypothetical protein